MAVYQYDGQGRRTAKIVRVVDGETVTYERTDYQYDEAWQVLEERSDSFEVLGGEGGALETPAETPAVQWLWDVRYVDSPVLRWRSVSGTLDEVLYFCNDANMNVTALVNTSGTVVERYVYDPYGKATCLDLNWANGQATSRVGNEILYCGYRFDPETGLDQVRYRYYHPTLGRWVSRDQEGYAQGPSLYQNVYSDPIDNQDPEGLSTYTSKPIVVKTTLPDGEEVKVVKVHRYEASPFNPLVWAYGGEAAGDYAGSEVYEYDESAPDMKGRMIDFEYANGSAASQIMKEWLRQNPNAFYGSYAQFKSKGHGQVSGGGSDTGAKNIEPYPLIMYRPLSNRLAAGARAALGGRMSVPDPAEGQVEPPHIPDRAAAIAYEASAGHPAEPWKRVEQRADRIMGRQGGVALLGDTVRGASRGLYEAFAGLNEVQVRRWQDKDTGCVGWYMSGTLKANQGPQRLTKDEALGILTDWFGTAP